MPFFSYKLPTIYSLIKPRKQKQESEQNTSHTDKLSDRTVSFLNHINKVPNFVEEKLIR